MKLLICTQKVDKNDPILGFFHRWIEEFAKHYEEVTVVCLYEGAHTLPANVTVVSLGKELGVPKIEYLIQFYRDIWVYRGEYDHVLVHMNPVYVVLGGVLWRVLGKRIALWYTHKSVDTKLKVAEELVHHIFTASKESFRLPSEKVVVTGHAIDVDEYSDVLHVTSNITRLSIIGRISPSKRIDLFIKTVAELRKRGVEAEGTIVGGGATPMDAEYVDAMKSLTKELGVENNIHFVGAVTHDEIKKYLATTDIFLHTSETGSMDKSVLEALASSVAVFSSSEAFKDVLSPVHTFLHSTNPSDIASEVLSYIKRDEKEREEGRERLMQYVRTIHSLEQTITMITNTLKSGVSDTTPSHFA